MDCDNQRLNISAMTTEKGAEISIIKTQELLSKAQFLLRELQELLKWCTSTDNAQQTWHRMIRQDRPVNAEDKGETLVIEGFRFESVTSREGLQRLCSQGGSGCHFRGATRD